MAFCPFSTLEEGEPSPACCLPRLLLPASRVRLPDRVLTGSPGVRPRQMRATLPGEAQPFSSPGLAYFTAVSKKQPKFEAIMPLGPPPMEHSPPSLRQDDSAQIIPLIVSTCVDSQLGPSFPPNLRKLDPGGGLWRPEIPSLRNGMWTPGPFPPFPISLLSPLSSPVCLPTLLRQPACTHAHTYARTHAWWSVVSVVAVLLGADLSPWPGLAVADRPGEGRRGNVKSFEGRD